MNKYVVDASVLVSFLIGSNPAVKKEFTTLLKQVQQGHALFLSNYLLPLEVGNALRFSLQDSELAGKALSGFSVLPVRYLTYTYPQLQKILELSYQLKTTFYDTSYHVLAKLNSAEFITCDAKYFRKAGDYGNIRLL